MLSSARLENGLRILFVGLFALLLVSSVSRTVSVDLDFKVFHKAAAQFVAGDHHFYPAPGARMELFTYKYSPSFPALFAPFGLLSEKPARWVWALLNAVLLCATWWLCLQFLRRYGVPLGWGVQLLSLGMVLDYLTLNAIQGNVNLVLFFLMMAALWLGTNPQLSWGRATLAAALAAVATSIKLTPGVVLVFFALDRRWRELALSALFCIVLFFLLPLLLYGPSETVSLYEGWIRVLRDRDHFPFLKHTNQSVIACASRWGISPRGLWIGLNLALIGLLVTLVRKRDDARTASLLMILTLTLPSIVWIEYHLVLLLPLLVVNSQLLNGRVSAGWLALWVARVAVVHVPVQAFIGAQRAITWNFAGNHLVGALLLALLLALPPFTPRRSRNNR